MKRREGRTTDKCWDGYVIQSLFGLHFVEDSHQLSIRRQGVVRKVERHSAGVPSARTPTDYGTLGCRSVECTACVEVEIVPRSRFHRTSDLPDPLLLRRVGVASRCHADVSNSAERDPCT